MGLNRKTSYSLSRVAPYGNDETPSFTTKIIASKPVCFPCYQDSNVSDGIGARDVRLSSMKATMPHRRLSSNSVPWLGGSETQQFPQYKTHIRVYPRGNQNIRNLDFSPREMTKILPPISNSAPLSQEEITLLKLAYGRVLYNAKTGTLEKVKHELISELDIIDIQSRSITKVKADEVLQRNNVVLDQPTENLFNRKFGTERGHKVNVDELIRFLDNAWAVYGGKQAVGNDQGRKRGSKRRHPSRTSEEFNLTSKPNQVSYDHYMTPVDQSRTKINDAFTERRDADLRRQCEKCFQEYRGQSDVWYEFDKLKRAIMSHVVNQSGDNDRRITLSQSNIGDLQLIKKLEEEQDNKITGLAGKLELEHIVKRHMLPLNDALIHKLIERLDPHNSGYCTASSCEEFLDFLEKALHGSQLNGIGHKKDTRVKEEQLQNPINWNTHKVLKPIESKRSKPGDASDYWKNPAWNETEQDKKYNSGRTYTGEKSKGEVPEIPKEKKGHYLHEKDSHQLRKIQKALLEKIERELLHKADANKLVSEDTAKGILDKYNFVLDQADINSAIQRSEFNDNCACDDLMYFLTKAISYRH